MTLMLDPEPTISAGTVEDETQSLHAWSMADDADTVVAYQPVHSWKIPAFVATLAALAAVTAGVFLAWPQSATKPQVAPAKPHVAAPALPSIAPSPPVQVQSSDQRFVALMKAQGFVETGSDSQVAAAGRKICADLTSGRYTLAQVITGIENGSGVSHVTATRFAETAVDVFCPQVSP